MLNNWTWHVHHVILHNNDSRHEGIDQHGYVAIGCVGYRDVEGLVALKDEVVEDHYRGTLCLVLVIEVELQRKRVDRERCIIRTGCMCNYGVQKELTILTRCT